MSKRFLLVLFACVVGLGLIFWLTSGNSSTSSSSNTPPTNHVEGEGKDSVTLVEYGDYECPICYAYYPVVKQVAAKYNTDIYFQFRNLPLTQIHKNAFAGARAAEAASLQGKFWQMHDLLYENQDPNGQTGWVAANNPLSYFVSYAQQLGLNTNKFQQDYDSDTVNNLINADLSAFNKTGNEMATPTFFLDGKKLDNTQLTVNNAPDLGKFSAIIDTEIAAKSK